MDDARTARKRGDFDRLLQLLAHGDRVTRLGAAQELGKLGDQRAVPALIACLQASDCLLRSSAAKSLGEIGDARALEPLHSMAVEDENPLVRGQAAAELFRLGDARGFLLLSELLHESETRSPQHWRRWMARLAVESRSREAIPHLRAAKRGSSPWARRRLAQAIRQLERLDPGDAG
jgi:HEAT repeat protein